MVVVVVAAATVVAEKEKACHCTQRYNKTSLRAARNVDGCVVLRFLHSSGNDVLMMIVV